MIRQLSKAPRDIAGDKHWQVLCGKLWTDKPGFGGRRCRSGAFAASGELTVADRALQSSQKRKRPSCASPYQNLEPTTSRPTACRRLNWRESYDGSVKDATRTEITAQEERWPWLCMDYMGFRGTRSRSRPAV